MFAAQNNDECVSILCPHRRPDYQRQPDYEDNRNPYWLAAGIETAEGTIEFSQPEIALYNRSSIRGNGTCEPGYADFMEAASGQVSVITTQKTQALCARVEPALVTLLWAQLQGWAMPPVSSEGLVLSFGPGPAEPSLPPHALPSLSQAWRAGAGITIELWLRHRSANDTLVHIGSPEGSSGGLSLLAEADGAAQMRVSDGQAAGELTTDPTCSRALAAAGAHHLVLTLDAGPLIATFVVDGVLCDGGAERWRGWAWLPQDLTDVSGAADRIAVGAPNEIPLLPMPALPLTVCPRWPGGAVESGRLYGRALRVSEAVASFRAGQPSK